MTFYMMPPRGNSQLGTLTEDTKTRLIYLCELSQRWGDAEKVQRLLSDIPELAYKSDSLIEGTKRDAESYFILKLASLSDRKFEAFLTEAETHFFEHRLTCGGYLTIKRAVAEAVRHFAIALETWGMTEDQQEFMTDMVLILQTLMKSGMSDCKDRELCHHSIMVPWNLVLPLVRGREVELIGGQAMVECHQVVSLLRCLFSELLTVVHKQLVTSKVEEAAQNDDRLSDIMRGLQGLFRTRWLGSSVRPHRSLKHEDVERESKYFPLCMKELFRKLQEKNRLRHHERYRFTIFLKDIGLPLEENLAFWEKYYSRSPGGGCQHTWESQRNRYTYSIRHVYGLEGARYTRSSHSCSKLQSIQPSHQDMGGCPLSGYNFEELLPHLVPLLGPSKHILEVIAKEVSASRPMAACQILMAFTTYMKNRNTTFHSPALHTSGEGLVHAKNHVNIPSNVSRSAGSQACADNPIIVRSDVSRSAGKNVRRDVTKCAESFAYAENPVNVPSDVSRSAGSWVCAEDPVNVPSDASISAGSRVCAENPVNVPRNISRFAQSLMCNEEHDNVPSDVSRSAGENAQSSVIRSAGSLVCAEDLVNVQSDVSRCAGKNVSGDISSSLGSLVCAENPVSVPNRPARENKGSDLVHLVTGKHPQCPGLSTSGYSGCHMNCREGDVLSAAGGAPTSGAVGAQGASPSPATRRTGSCREDNFKRKTDVSGECSTTNITPVCDIEDIMSLMPKCVFCTPVQYYLKIVSDES